MINVFMEEIYNQWMKMMKFSKQVLTDILNNRLDTYYFVAHSELPDTNPVQLRIRDIIRQYNEYDILLTRIKLNHYITFTPGGPITHVTMSRNGIEYYKFPLATHRSVIVGDTFNVEIELSHPFDMLFDSDDIKRLHYWNDKTIPRLIKEKVPIPVIADAIEDAGCTNRYLVQHFRDWWPHTHLDCHVEDYISWYPEVGGFMKEQEARDSIVKEQV